jgi:hypothetical protein
VAINNHEDVVIKAKKTLGTVAGVVAQLMGARYRVRPVSEVVTQMAGDMSCQKLSSINWFPFKNLLLVWLVNCCDFSTYFYYFFNFFKLLLSKKCRSLI